MVDAGLKLWFLVVSFASMTTLLLTIRMWFRIRVLEKLERAKALDLYEQIDKLKNKLDVMFN